MTGKIFLITVYAVSSILLVGYGIQCYILTILYLRKRKKVVEYQKERMKYFEGVKDISKYPKVLVQIPMFNEKNVAERIIDAVAAFDYPHEKLEIQILDDSNDDTINIVDNAVARHRENGINIYVVRRENRVGFKAGALQYGLEKSDAEYVAIFDADFVPNPDFLKKAIPFFIDNPEIGLVQGRWTHLNRNTSLLTKSQAMGIDGHFMIEQAARSWNGLYMNFNGTAGVFRISAIYDAGGWQHDTLTEDMDLSYRMQLAGWKTEYVPALEVPAELPEDINAFKNQQFRWAKGSIQTALKIIPKLKEENISFFKFIQAVLHLTHYSVHPLMLTIAVLSIPMLAFTKLILPVPLFVLMGILMLLATGGPSTMYLVAQHFIGNKKRYALLLIPAMMLTGTGLAVNNTRAVLEALFGKDSPFYRTPKRGDKKMSIYKPLKDITPFIEIFLGIYCMYGFNKFLGYTNFLVAPFLAIYSSGFIFTGLLSIIHFKKPEFIDKKIIFATLFNK